MAAAVIVDAVRTPTGKRTGKLLGWHLVDLAAEVLQALVARNDTDLAMIDDLIVAVSAR
jgi:acetyl-CoA acetyltransferase